MTAPTWFEVTNHLAARMVPEHADWVLVHLREPVVAAVRRGDLTTSDGLPVGPPQDGEPLVIATLRHRDAELEVALNDLVLRLAPAVGDPYGSGRVTATGVTRLASHVEPAHLRAIAKNDDDHLLLQQLDLGSAVIAPVVAGHVVLGAVNLVRRQGSALEGDQMEAAEELGRRFGAALGASLPATAALPRRPVRQSVSADFDPPREGNPVAAARRWARRMLPELVRAPSRADLASDVDLVVSELAGNAVRHGGGLVDVHLEGSAGGVRLSVGDGQDREPVRREPSVDVDSGRGMVLVEAVTTAWGVEHLLARGGKRVWAELSL